VGRFCEQGDRVREISADGLYEGEAAEDHKSEQQPALTGVLPVAVMMAMFVMVRVAMVVMVIVGMVMALGVAVPRPDVVMALWSHGLESNLAHFRVPVAKSATLR
jgi:hypothetical protein